MFGTRGADQSRLTEPLHIDRALKAIGPKPTGNALGASSREALVAAGASDGVGVAGDVQLDWNGEPAHAFSILFDHHFDLIFPL